MARDLILPRSISVLGKVFTVKLVANLKDSDGSPLFGITDPNSRTITLCSSADQASLESTFFHELIHATLAVAGVSELLDEKLEESLTVALENGLSGLYTLRCKPKRRR